MAKQVPRAPALLLFSQLLQNCFDVDWWLSSVFLRRTALGSRCSSKHLEPHCSSLLLCSLPSHAWKSAKNHSGVWTSTWAEPVEIHCCLRKKKKAGLAVSSASFIQLHLFDLILQLLPHSCFLTTLSLEFFNSLSILLFCLLDELTIVLFILSSPCLLVSESLHFVWPILQCCALAASPAFFFHTLRSCTASPPQVQL